MEPASLQQKLKQAKIVIGDVELTCATFFREYNPAPVGCIFHDLDYYSSTSAALSLFDASPSFFLPRVFMYFDDVIGNNDTWLCSDFTGERLAIEEFNKSHDLQKISRNYYLPLRHPHEWWPHHIYIYHDFGHSKYNEFIGDKEQELHEHSIRLDKLSPTLQRSAQSHGSFEMGSIPKKMSSVVDPF